MTPLIEVRDVTKHFPIKRGILLRSARSAPCRPSTASASTCMQGETLGIVGETRLRQEHDRAAAVPAAGPDLGRRSLFDGREVGAR